MKINSDAIRELADLLDETGLTEIEVADGDQSIRVNKGGVMMAGAGAAPVAMASDPTIPQAANADAPQTTAIDEHPGAVTAPMVGTAYMAAEPGAAAFVTKGKNVNEGDTLMIIEAMKVMNPIKAPRSGTVTHITVENGTPVEYGDVLMVIE